MSKHVPTLKLVVDNSGGYVRPQKIRRHDLSLVSQEFGDHRTPAPRHPSSMPVPHDVVGLARELPGAGDAAEQVYRVVEFSCHAHRYITDRDNSQVASGDLLSRWVIGTLRCMGKRRKPKQFTTLTGARLYAIRMVYGAGQTQTEFAERFGATQNQWSQWESGRSPPDLETMIRLGDKLDVGLDWIYRGKESDLPGARAAEILAAMPPLSETG